MNNYFDDSEYITRLFAKKEKSKINKNNEQINPLEEAYKQASDIRKFEIELFWSRGTYYWAFILAAFTAHFSLFGLLFSNSCCESTKGISLKNMCDLPGFSLLALALTVLICFFFSLAWTLVNKGSKFWQKNWEAHIDALEDQVTGKLYKTYLNTNLKGEGSEFDESFLSTKAYDFSVTKITILTSIFLTIISGCMFLFYVFLMFLKWRKYYVQFVDIVIWGVVPVLLVIILGIIIATLIEKGKSSNFTNSSETEKRWYQKPRTPSGKGL